MSQAKLKLFLGGGGGWNGNNTGTFPTVRHLPSFSDRLKSMVTAGSTLNAVHVSFSILADIPSGPFDMLVYLVVRAVLRFHSHCRVAS